ncbi:MAG: alpha/beta family hydrolase [Nitriliruptoraceae bacterium]
MTASNQTHPITWRQPSDEPVVVVSQIDEPVLTLTGVRYLPHPQPVDNHLTCRIAVLLPGAGGTYQAEGLDVLARTFAKAGIDTLVTNLPHNELRRPPANMTRNVAVFSQLVNTFIGLANPHNDRPCQVIVGGKSYGARVAFTYAAAASPVHLAGVVAYGFPLHPPGKTVRRDTMFADLGLPGLFIQGSRDPFGSSAELADALHGFGGAATFVSITGGNHDGAVTKQHAPDGVKRTPQAALHDHADTFARWATHATATTT